jgi:hypothetical protein
VFLITDLFDQEWSDQAKHPGSRLHSGCIRGMKSTEGRFADQHELSAMHWEPLRFVPVKEVQFFSQLRSRMPAKHLASVIDMTH